MPRMGLAFKSDHPIKDPGSKQSRTPNTHFGLLETGLQVGIGNKEPDPWFPPVAFAYAFLFVPVEKRESRPL